MKAKVLFFVVTVLALTLAACATTTTEPGARESVRVSPPLIGGGSPSAPVAAIAPPLTDLSAWSGSWGGSVHGAKISFFVTQREDGLAADYTRERFIPDKLVGKVVDDTHIVFTGRHYELDFRLVGDEIKGAQRSLRTWGNMPITLTKEK